MNYIFDGSYAGFLTTVFESFERKDFTAQIFDKSYYVPSFFEEDVEVFTDNSKAERVLKGLKKVVKANDVANFYKVFLSEDGQAQQAVFYIIQQLFRGEKEILKNFGDEKVNFFDKMLTKVNRERHRMKAFIRFQKGGDGSYYALIEPDFNVLPLIISFFKNRYADQNWLIYDVKRKYGVFYDRVNIQEVQLSPIQENSLVRSASTVVLDETEEHFQTLWKRYFKSTNIEARKNMKLHLQHVPRRYWKYLTEKD